MLIWFYFFAAINSLLCVLYYFEITMNKVNQKHLLILVFSAFSNIAYFFAANSESLEAYLIAYDFFYIGNVASMVLIVLLILEICGYKDKKIFRRLLCLFACFIIFLVFSIDYNNLYYASFSFAKENSVAYLNKEYGPLHIFMLLFVFGSNFFCILVTIFSYYKKKAFSTRITAIILTALCISSITYILPKILHVNIEAIPFIFTFVDVLFVILFKRASIYDMSDNLLRVYEERFEYGYLALDKNFRFVGASDLALLMFPELKKVSIDSKIECNDCDLSEKLLPWIYDYTKGSTTKFIYTKNEVTVTCSIKDIKYGKKKVGFLIELRDISNEQKYINLINTYNSQLETKVEEKTLKIQTIQDSIISSMASMVESRDNSTGGHIKRTSKGVNIFVEELIKPENNKWHLTESFCKKLSKAAPMHDLGKIAVDDIILRKPGKFEPEEYEQMKKHSAEGAKIVKEVLCNVDDDEFVQIAVNVAHYHHEKWNGKGYPEGLNENKIPLEARIMAFADVFDALVSKRCYKDSFSFEKAFEIINNDLGSHFDPELGLVFLKCRPKLEKFYSSLEQ